MKKIVAWFLLAGLMLLASAALAEVSADFAAYEDYGRVIAAETTEQGTRIEAEGYYGYHMDASPSMTVAVEIAPDGMIVGAEVTGAKDQTPGFDAMITGEYLNSAYVGQAADPAMEVQAVSGATVTSRAVLYAVQTAAYYAQNALGYAADTDAADKAELSAVYPAVYTALHPDELPDTKKIGTLLFAAEGTTAEGTRVIAMKIKSATKVAQAGSARTGWDSSVPNPFTMIIVVDCASSQICAWSLVQDGTRNPEYFTVPDEKIDAYRGVVIEDAAVFDEFMEGIVLTLDLDYTLEDTADGPVFTGTSIVYTGKTEQGTFSSQMVRNCFRTAAAIYCHLTAQ